MDTPIDNDYQIPNFITLMKKRFFFFKIDDLGLFDQLPDFCWG